MLARDGADLFDRLDRADLVVGVHDADQDGARGDGAANGLGIDAARRVDGQICHARAEPLKKPAWGENGGVLDLGRDDVLALVAEREECALDRKVVGFAAAAREHDLIGRTA